MNMHSRNRYRTLRTIGRSENAEIDVLCLLHDPTTPAGAAVTRYELDMTRMGSGNVADSLE